MSREFRIRRTTMKSGRYRYSAFLVVGWLDGTRIRRQFKTRGEAEGERARLEVAAANTEGAMVRPVNTRLTAAQVAVAETVFGLTADPLGAVQWYLANYRDPIASKPIEAAADAFLQDRAIRVRPAQLRDYRREMIRLRAVFAGRTVDSVTTGDVQQLLDKRQVGPKAFNNRRANLNAFFAWCRQPPREWCRANPVAPIPQHRVSRGLPSILSPGQAAELMAFLEGFAGGERAGHPPGFLVPFVALALFAGIRPSIDDGELSRLAKAPHLIDLKLGVIRITPDVAKTRHIRQIKIRPNLAAWLTRYPPARFPIIGKGWADAMSAVRKKFGLAHDVLRHSFVSHHVGAFRSLGDAALEAGNSEAIIRSHYLNMVAREDAEAFWRIMPAPHADNVVPLPVAAAG